MLITLYLGKKKELRPWVPQNLLINSQFGATAGLKKHIQYSVYCSIP